jgi:hypothetical protein
VRARVATDRVVDAYQRARSVWKAGAELGISGQTVSAILKKAGVACFQKRFSESEMAAVRDYYENTPPDVFKLDVLAEKLGRTKHLICRQARTMGLTDPTRPPTADERQAISISARTRIAENGHPRGMLGKRHNPETLTVLSVEGQMKWRRWKETGTGMMSKKNREMAAMRARERFSNLPAEKVYSRAASGRRADLGDIYFRSRWEANYARYLNLLVKMGVVTEWAYEPETFWFEGIRRGTASYKPDFRVRYKDDPTPVYVELKGWVQPKDRTKWKRMAKYHPHIKLEIIGAKEFAALKAKWASAIPNWEHQTGKLVLQPSEGVAA